MEANLRVTLETLKQWEKAMIRLRNGGEDLGDRQAQVNRLSQQLITLLQHPKVATELNRLIDNARTLSPEEFDQLQTELEHPSRSLVESERRSLLPLMPSGREWERLLAEYRKMQATQDPDTPPKPANSEPSDSLKTLPTDTQMLVQQFSQMQATLVEHLEASREMSRKPKKRRKRRISLGILQTTVGIALLVGNTRVFQDHPNASYILGGNSLIQAMRDLMGEET
ncbi:hypothetical protein [Vacuolonema iberomarrocanum]|uniref:hypothetical protein n=1 Tax=Vacuolonema iberomarrocanum TaxID=3454632 RepID=UPI0019EC65BB|nr:hypothetical protein [filamentous cyanobacterium LEGE 07170]